MRITTHPGSIRAACSNRWIARAPLERDSIVEASYSAASHRE